MIKRSTLRKQIRVICINKTSLKCPIYNIILNKLIRKIELKKQPCLIQIMDKNRLMVGISNGDVMVFDMSTAKLISNLVGHAYQVLQIITFADQYMITLCQNREARIWSCRNLQMIFKINHNFSVKHIYFSQDGQKVILVAYDGSVKIYQTQTGEIINQINHNIQQVYLIKFFQQINQCFIAYQDKNEKQSLLWNLEDYSNKKILNGINQKVKDVFINWNNFDLAVVFYDSTKIIIYNLLTAKVKAQIDEGLNNSQISVKFNKSNQLIITNYQSIFVYTEDGKFLQQLNKLNDDKGNCYKIVVFLNYNDRKINDQIINQDEQANNNDIWLQTSTHFKPIR